MADQIITSDANPGAIRLTVKDYGSIYFDRDVASSWIPQIGVSVGYFDGRMAIIYLDSERFQTHSVNSWKFTPVSNNSTSDTVTTVLSAGSTGVVLTQTAQVFPDEKYVKYVWSFYNGGSNTYNDVKMFTFAWQRFQNDGYWIEGYGWEAARNMVYASWQNSAIMGIYSITTPPDQYLNASWSNVMDFVLDRAELPNLAIGQEANALGWTTSSFGPGETWEIEAYEMCYYEEDSYEDQPSNRSKLYPSMYYPDPAHPGEVGGPTYRRFYGYAINGPWPDPNQFQMDVKIGNVTDRYDLSNGFSSATWEILHSATQTSLAQSFTVSSTSKLWYVFFTARPIGTWDSEYPDIYWDPFAESPYQNLPPQKYRAKIYTHTGTFGSTGIPGTLLATSKEYYVKEYQGGPQWTKVFFFEGSEAITLTPGNYFAAIEFTEGDANKYLNVYVDATSPSHPGNYASLTGSTWTANASKDLWFQLVTDDNQLFYEDGDPVYSRWQEGEGYFWRGDGMVARGETVSFSPSGATGKYGPTMYNSWGYSSGGLAPYVLTKSFSVVATSGTPAQGDTITGNSSGAQGLVVSSPYRIMAPIYQNYQRPMYANWPNVSAGYTKVLEDSDYKNTYIEVDKDSAYGLPDWYLGSSIWEDYGEVEFIVLPWDSNIREPMFYGNPPSSDRKIYYSIDSIWDQEGLDFTWYVESAGSGTIVPYVVDPDNPHTTWVDSYFFSWPSIIYPAKSVITEVGQDTQGFWFKMRPMTISDPWSGLAGNHAARNWNQTTAVAYTTLPIGRAWNYSSEDFYVTIEPWGEYKPSNDQGRLIW